MLNNRIKIKTICQRKEITLLAPAFINKHPFKAVFRSKINIRLVCRRVYARLKLNAIKMPVIPPFPCTHTWLYPRIIALRRRGKIMRKLLLDKPNWRIGNNENAPWECAPTTRLDNPVVAILHTPVVSPDISLLSPNRILPKNTFYLARLAAISPQVPASVVAKIRLGHKHCCAARKMHRKRKIRNAASIRHE